MERIGIVFCLICCFGAALGTLIWAIVKKDRLVLPFLLGALCFTVFQLLTRLPLLQFWLPYQPWYAMLASSMPYLYIALLGVSAAVFEECGRLLVMALFLRKRRRFCDGLSFGFGHGCTEAVTLVGVNMLLLLVTGNEQAVSAGDAFLAGAERLFTLPLHAAFSVMVMESLASRRAAPFFWALLLHAAVDIFAGAAALIGIAPLVIEGVLLMASLLLVYYMFCAKKRWVAFPLQRADGARDAALPGEDQTTEKELMPDAPDQTK